MGLGIGDDPSPVTMARHADEAQSERLMPRPLKGERDHDDADLEERELLTPRLEAGLVRGNSVDAQGEGRVELVAKGTDRLSGNADGKEEREIGGSRRRSRLDQKRSDAVRPARE